MATLSRITSVATRTMSTGFPKIDRKIATFAVPPRRNSVLAVCFRDYLAHNLEPGSRYYIDMLESVR